MLTDARGLALTVTDPAARDAFEEALAAFRAYRGDPLAPLDRAIALEPGFAAAYVAKALILFTLFERRCARDGLAVLDGAAKQIAAGNSREKALAAAARRLVEGDWRGGAAALDQVLLEHPRDILALQVGHLVDFIRGDNLNLRNRVSRVLPSWSPAVPGYAFVNGMHAFGLEECNQYAEAESAGMRALALAPEDCWAVHAVTHTHEMRGNIDQGIAFLEERKADWAAPDNGFAFHNWWHLALFHLDRGDTQAALAVYDEVLGPAHAMVLSRVDATAMLWRLHLEGADVASRMEAVADAWQADLAAESGFYAFNDFHAALSFAATGRDAPIARLRQSMQAASWEKIANGEMTREVGIDLCEAIYKFGTGRYSDAADLLVAARDTAWKFGGSHAQRDILSLTLIEAARRAGRKSLAQHYLAERLVHKPAGQWGQRIAARIAAPLRRIRAGAAQPA
jgi:tetratricopeptide (TPR) repeat protein